MDMQGKNGLDIRNQQEKSYKNDKHFIFGFEKVLKMQASGMFCLALVLIPYRLIIYGII